MLAYISSVFVYMALLILVLIVGKERLMENGWITDEQMDVLSGDNSFIGFFFVALIPVVRELMLLGLCSALLYKNSL